MYMGGTTNSEDSGFTASLPRVRAPNRSLAPGRKGCYGGRSMDHGWYGDLAMIIGYHRCCLWRYQRNGGFYRKNIHERANFPWPCFDYRRLYIKLSPNRMAMGFCLVELLSRASYSPWWSWKKKNSLGDGSKWCTKKHFLSIDIVKWG